MSVRVVKVGGSLLRLRSLASALPAWLEKRSGCNVLLCGGGIGADWIRELDARFQLGPAKSHWLCVRGLSITARVLADLVPNSVLLTSLIELRQHLVSGSAQRVTAVFDPADFLTREEPRLAGFALPATWDTSSDSIAARLAQAIRAEHRIWHHGHGPLQPFWQSLQ